MKVAWAVASLLGTALAACGGGTPDTPPSAYLNPSWAPTPLPTTPQPGSPGPAPGSSAIPEGLYVGSTSTGRAVTGIILDDGTYYVLYSAINNPGVIAGAGQGSGTASNGIFTSTNGRDINLEGLGMLNGSVTASYVAKTSLSGMLNYPSLNQTISFTATYDSAYEVVPSLAAVAGVYTGRAGTPQGSEAGTLTISPSGAVTSKGASGCMASGTITPRAKGSAYNVSMTFAGPPCLFQGATFSGGAFYDQAARRLYGVGLNQARDFGFIFAGTKP